MSIKNSFCRFAFCLSFAATVPSAWAATNVTTTGCGSPAFGSSSGGATTVTVDCSTKNVYGGQKTSKYERDLHTLLLVQNATEVQISKVELGSWLEDGGRVSLNVTFNNPRNIPIGSLEVDVMNPTTGSSLFSLRPFKLERSRIFKNINSNKVSIAANSTTKLPVAFLDEIQKTVFNVAESYCPYDASAGLGDGFGTDEYVQAQQAAILKMTTMEIRRTQQRSSSLILRISIKSIFGQELISFARASVHYAEKNGTSEIWYPNKKVFAPVECVSPVAS